MLGDRYGSSAARWVVETIEYGLKRFGLAARRNKPYAGGYITEHYGVPSAGRHAVQIEINRALYMDERTIELSPGAATLMQALATMVAELCARAQEAPRTRWAAE